jgi:uncharacterized protein (DUF433 family)
MDYRKRISRDPLIRSGKPCVRGTTIAVSDVINYLADGKTFAEVLEDLRVLTDEDIHACVRFAAEPWPLDGSAD